MRGPLCVLLSALCVDCVHLQDRWPGQGSPGLPARCQTKAQLLAWGEHMTGAGLLQPANCSASGCGIDNKELFPFPATDIFGISIPSSVDCVDFTYDEIGVTGKKRTGTRVVGLWDKAFRDTDDPVPRKLYQHAWVGAVEQTCADYGSGRMRCDPTANFNEGWCTDLESARITMHDWVLKNQLEICKAPCDPSLSQLPSFGCENELGNFTNEFDVNNAFVKGQWTGIGQGPWPLFSDLMNLATGEALDEPNPFPLPCTASGGCTEQDCEDAFGFEAADVCDFALCVSSNGKSGYTPTVKAHQACCACGGGIRRENVPKQGNSIQESCGVDQCEDVNIEPWATSTFTDPGTGITEPVWADIVKNQLRVCKWRPQINASHYQVTFNPDYVTSSGENVPFTTMDNITGNGMVAWDLGNMGGKFRFNPTDPKPVGWLNPDEASGMVHAPGWCSDEQGIYVAQEDEMDRCGGGDCLVPPKVACCACGGGCVKFPCPLTGQWDESWIGTSSDVPGYIAGCSEVGGCETTRVRCPGSSASPTREPTAQPTVQPTEPPSGCQICPNGTVFDGDKTVPTNLKQFCKRTQKYGKSCDTCEEASKRDMPCEYLQDLLRGTCCPYVPHTPEPTYPATPDPTDYGVTSDPTDYANTPDPTYGEEPEPECGEWVQGRNCKGFKHRMVIVKQSKFNAYGQRQKKRVQKVMSQDTCWGLCEDNDMYCCRWQKGTGRWGEMDWGKCWGTRAESMGSADKWWARTQCGEPVTPPTYRKKKPSYPKKPSRPQYPKPPPSYPPPSYSRPSSPSYPKPSTGYYR